MKINLNQSILESGQSLGDVQNIFNTFTLSVQEDYSQVILHGKMCLDDIGQNVVVHIYFNKETDMLENVVIHPFPMEYKKMQSYLEEQFGLPNCMAEQNKNEWAIDKEKIIHYIADRFGEEEIIIFNFV